jgi:hypothetical protein
MRTVVAAVCVDSMLGLAHHRSVTRPSPHAERDACCSSSTGEVRCAALMVGRSRAVSLITEQALTELSSYVRKVETASGLPRCRPYQSRTRIRMHADGISLDYTVPRCT